MYIAFGSIHCSKSFKTRVLEADIQMEEVGNGVASGTEIKHLILHQHQIKPPSRSRHIQIADFDKLAAASALHDVSRGPDAKQQLVRNIFTDVICRDDVYDDLGCLFGFCA